MKTEIFISKSTLTKTGKLRAATLKALRGLEFSKKKRMLGSYEIDKLIKAIESTARFHEIKTMRIYPAGGFVSNSYSYAASIECFEVTIDDDRVYTISRVLVGAKRPGGEGAIFVINGREGDGWIERRVEHSATMQKAS